jgi:hypothetical protein
MLPGIDLREAFNHCDDPGSTPVGDFPPMFEAAGFFHPNRRHSAVTIPRIDPEDRLRG